MQKGQHCDFTTLMAQSWENSVHDIGISADNLCLEDALVPHVPQVLLLYPESEPKDESPLGGLGDALGPLQHAIPGSSPPGHAPPAPICIGP